MLQHRLHFTFGPFDLPILNPAVFKYVREVGKTRNRHHEGNGIYFFFFLWHSGSLSLSFFLNQLRFACWIHSCCRRMNDRFNPAFASPEMKQSTLLCFGSISSLTLLHCCACKYCSCAFILCAVMRGCHMCVLMINLHLVVLLPSTFYGIFSVQGFIILQDTIGLHHQL